MSCGFPQLIELEVDTALERVPQILEIRYSQALEIHCALSLGGLHRLSCEGVRFQRILLRWLAGDQSFLYRDSVADQRFLLNRHVFS